MPPTSVNDAREQIKALAAEVETARANMRTAAQNVLADGTRAIFEEYGDLIHQFGWIQYTPFFNDGDPCTFSMRGLAIIAKEDLAPLLEKTGLDPSDTYEVQSAMDEWEWRWEGSPAFGGYGGEEFGLVDKTRTTVGYSWENNIEPNPNFDQRYADAKEACEAIYELCSADKGTIALDTFGDHVSVIFTPDGVDVEEYDHD